MVWPQLASAAARASPSSSKPSLNDRDEGVEGRKRYCIQRNFSRAFSGISEKGFRGAASDALRLQIERVGFRFVAHVQDDQHGFAVGHILSQIRKDVGVVAVHGDLRSVA